MTYDTSARFLAILLFAGATMVPARNVAAQTTNVLLPIPEIEERLQRGKFSIVEWRGSRKPEDRTQRALLLFEDSMVMTAKWASAPRGGGVFNNQPRYEAAAYAIQRLFFDEDDYVVPPTVIRAFPLEFVTSQLPDQRATFGRAPQSVVAALQYWLTDVNPRDFWQPQRLRTDTVYARRIANFNILTYLIGHRDSNLGNYLISVNESDPHVFSVDNGVSFDSDAGDRGEAWREMRVDRLPRSTVERLRAVTRADLENALGVLAEFQIIDGELVPVEAGENLGRNTGVRTKDDRVQFGLTAREIRGVESRLKRLVQDANGRRYTLF